MGFKPQYLVFDGNHRLAASLYRNEEWLAISYSGSTTEFFRMFPKRRAPTDEELAYHGSHLAEDDAYESPAAAI